MRSWVRPGGEPRGRPSVGIRVTDTRISGSDRRAIPARPEAQCVKTNPRVCRCEAWGGGASLCGCISRRCAIELRHARATGAGDSEVQ